ncbi:bis(5'-nucleosyl)-tetraphosphatase [Endomicrobium proavitum]|uniref:Bis(5'-nucleosyl)-tetraphosphatase [asymmetrical] n=1 Tax=Endomicrobium proavitum TaxID=1408281 RepID=A0A0G3WLA8_9BACT|nr:NUDIX domain-containing protein [Endomicrobium proavitum]AKL98294.1 NUDIX family hydrolase [Endomicrobium proavitum]
MLKEFSCGAVVYKVESGQPVFLLVFSKRNGNWGFPKGHIESGETEKSAAKREIFEETGISEIEFVGNFRAEDTYIISGALKETKDKPVEKHSVYFLAKALIETEKYDVNEISEVAWFNKADAKNKLSFENQKKMLELANEAIIKTEGI